MSTVIEDFFVSLGFEVDDKGVSQFVSTLGKARNVMLGVVAAAGAAAGAVTAFVNSVARDVDELGDFAELNRVSVEYLQEMGFAAEQNGSSLEAVKSTVEGLNNTLGQAARGIGRAAAIFRQLGFSAKDSNGQVKSLSDFLGEVATKIAPFSRQEQIGIVSRLGISPTLIPLLLKGREGMEALRAEARALGRVTGEEAQKASDYADELNRVNFAVRGLKEEIAIGLMPTLQPMIAQMRSWVVQNRELISSGVQNFLSVVGNVLGTVRDVVSGVLNGISALIGKFTGLEDSAGRTAVALGVLLAALFPIQAGIAAISAAVALLIDDFQTWREGGDSLFGTFATEFPEVIELFTTLWDAIKPLIGAVFELAKVIGSVLGPVLKFLGFVLGGLIRLIALLLQPLIKFFGGLATEIINIITGVTGIVGAVIQKVFGWLFDFIDSAREKVTNVIEAISNAYEKVKNLFSGTANVNVSGGLAGGKAGPLPRAGVLGVAANAAPPAQQTTNTVTVGDITVISPNPEKAGAAVAERLNNAARTAARNGQSAVQL